MFKIIDSFIIYGHLFYNLADDVYRFKPYATFSEWLFDLFSNGYIKSNFLVDFKTLMAYSTWFYIIFTLYIEPKVRASLPEQVSDNQQQQSVNHDQECLNKQSSTSPTVPVILDEDPQTTPITNN